MINIEDEFKQLAKDYPEEFPDGKDYLSIYTILKQNFDKHVHSEIKTKILEIEKEGYFNDHGVDHITMVVDRASKIMNCFPKILSHKGNGLYLSAYELFILLIAINLHDTGHLIGSRSDHAKLGKNILASFDKGDLLSRPEKLIIGKIAQAHGGKNDPIGLLEQDMPISHKNIRPQLLAAILRLADELAEDSSRASNFLLKIENIEKTSEIFHRFSQSLDSLSILQGEIKMEFYIEKENAERIFPKLKSTQFLVDEIYERTLKTFTESLYCNRFLPEGARFNCVKVKIHFYDKEDNEEIIAPVAFTLKESGYPSLPANNIFDICDNLSINGKQKDGKYYSEKIKSLLKIEQNEEPL